MTARSKRSSLSPATRARTWCTPEQRTRPDRSGSESAASERLEHLRRKNKGGDLRAMTPQEVIGMWMYLRAMTEVIGLRDVRTELLLSSVNVIGRQMIWNEN